MPSTFESERPPADETLDPAEMLDKFKRDIINDADDLSEQRDKANADMRFINVTGGTWEDFLEQEFGSRTKLEFDLTSDFVNRFLGEWDLNRVGVEFKPEDAKTSDKDAELLNGIWRADFKDNDGKLSLDNAVDEVATCGYGCLKVATRFIDVENPENDLQRAEFRPIHNAYNMVIWDRAAKWINKKDARWCNVLEPFTRDSFEEVYPGEEAISAYQPHTRSYNDFTTRSKEQIYIATRYEVVRKKEPFFIYSNLATGEIEAYNEEDHELIKDELRKDKLRKKIRERVMIRQTIMKSTFSGEKFLQNPKRIPGKHIPIIPIYGYRSYVDGTERYHGLVRKLMDPQRLFNMQMSQLAEASASNNQDMPVFFPEQVEGLESLWAEPPHTKPYRLINKTVDEETKAVFSGPVAILTAPRLDQASQTLLQIVPQHIQQMTGGAPQDTLDPDASGKAIQALIKRENMKTFRINDNIANSAEWMGEVYQSIASEIYDSRRIMRTIGEDGTETEIQLFREIQDEETGALIQTNTLRGKRFKAYSDSGPQYETLREQTVEDLKGMMQLMIDAGQAGAKYVPLMATMMLENMSGVGLKSLKKMVRQDMIVQGLQDPETDEEKAMVQQLQQQAQQPDPQQQLMEAAAQQQISEAQKFQSEARNLDSKSIDNLASAKKKLAETRKILSEVGVDKAKSLGSMLNDTLKRNEERAARLPFGPS